MAAAATDQVVGRLSTLDRLLPAWILSAMGVGLGLGQLIPRLGHALNTPTSRPTGRG